MGWGETPEKEEGGEPLGSGTVQISLFQIPVSGVGRKGTHSEAEGRGGSARVL